MTKGLEVRFISPSGELLGLITDTTFQGAVLNFKITDSVLGGVKEFSFDISREVSIPFSRNTDCLFLVDGVRWFRGYIDKTPEPDQDNPVLTIKGLGLINKLKETKVSKSYTSQTFDYILKDILSTYLGYDVSVAYNVAKIASPTISNISIEFVGDGLLDVLNWLIEVANYDYENEKYRFWVDDVAEFNFGSYGDTVIKTFFEGFQYQKPDVSSSSDSLVNSIICYRATAVDSDTVEFVINIQDTGSISRNGLKEVKLTFPSYIDSTTIANIANAKILRQASKVKTIKCSLPVSSPVDFGAYLISNRRKSYWELVNDCEDLTDWVTGTLQNATVSLDNTHVLSGRTALRISYASNGAGYISYDLPVKIPLPSILRAFAYTDANGVDAYVKFYDDTGNQLTLDISSSLKEQWVKLEKEMVIATNEDDLFVDDGVSVDLELDVNIDETTVDNLEVRDDAEATIRDVSRVEVGISATVSGDIWIDNMEAFAKVYKSSQLLLEEAKYELSNTRKEAFLSLGDKPISIIDSINEQVDAGNTALDIFTKG